MQSTISGEVTAFVGNRLEWTGSTTTMKCCYYAGFTSLTSDGIQVSNLLYKPCPQGVLCEGESRYNSGALPTKYTYTGQYSNMSDFGLMYYNARWYDPALGRFTSADTLIPEPGNPQSWDRYADVENNPLHRR